MDNKATSEQTAPARQEHLKYGEMPTYTVAKVENIVIQPDNANAKFILIDNLLRTRETEDRV